MGGGEQRDGGGEKVQGGREQGQVKGGGSGERGQGGVRPRLTLCRPIVILARKPCFIYRYSSSHVLLEIPSLYCTYVCTAARMYCTHVLTAVVVQRYW